MIPALRCPFWTRLNPVVDTLDEAAVAWGVRFQLLNAQTAPAFRAAKASWLLGWAYPDAPLERLQIMGDWNVYLMIWDDRSAAPGLGDNPVRLEASQTRFLEILDGAAVGVESDPLERGLADLVVRLAGITTSDWRTRFWDSVAEVFSGCLWEARNRASGRSLDLATYLERRLHTGALYPYLIFAEMTDGIALPPTVREHVQVRQLTVAANNLICWANDLLSLDKEIRQGETHNMALLLAKAEGLALQEAIDQVVIMHDQEVQHFLDLERTLPVFGPHVDPQVRRYVQLLRSWLRANMNWTFSSTRYLPPHMQVQVQEYHRSTQETTPGPLLFEEKIR
jgi:hypothetical protein